MLIPDNAPLDRGIDEELNPQRFLIQKENIMEKKITTKVLEDVLIGADGIIVRRKVNEVKIGGGYYYRHGQTQETFAAKMKEQLDKAFPGKFELKECGDHWAAFRGGATLWGSSHFWAIFSMKA